MSGGRPVGQVPGLTTEDVSGQDMDRPTFERRGRPTPPGLTLEDRAEALPKRAPTEITPQQALANIRRAKDEGIEPRFTAPVPNPFKGETVRRAAIRTTTGEVVEGINHDEAQDNAERELNRVLDHGQDFEDGFVTSTQYVPAGIDSLSEGHVPSSSVEEAKTTILAG